MLSFRVTDMYLCFVTGYDKSCIKLRDGCSNEVVGDWLKVVSNVRPRVLLRKQEYLCWIYLKVIYHWTSDP